MSEPFVVNVSSIQDFMTCRYRWVCKWVLNRVPRDTERPLVFGKLLHQIFEDHLARGVPMAHSVESHRAALVKAADGARSENDRQAVLDVVAELDSYAEPLGMWQDRYPMEPALEVEEPFTIGHPLDERILLRGRPDRMALLWGRLFHVQNRSLMAGMNFGLYCELAKRSLHEHVYAYAAQQKYPELPYGGTVMNLLRKLKYRGVPTKKAPQGKILHDVNEILWQGLVDITPERTTAMMGHVLYWCREMIRVRERFEAGEMPAPNERMNGGYYGNAIDPYFRVLEGEIALQDDRHFKPREDTYAPERGAA